MRGHARQLERRRRAPDWAGAVKVALGRVGMTGLMVTGLGLIVQGPAWAAPRAADPASPTIGAVAHAPADWTVVPSANASDGNNQLKGVVSISAADVWAVGSADDSNGNSQPLREHWDGSAWTVVPGPNDFSVLNGVTAASPDAVWAVGQSFGTAVIERFNGRLWEVVNQPATQSGTTLNGVAAVSARDAWAVGESASPTTGNELTLIEHFNGHSWSVVPSPSVGGRNNLLTAVAAVSAHDVWAVGTFQNDSNVFRTLVEHWDGTSWRIVASPNGAGVQAELLSVAALSHTNVWAGGSSGAETLLQRWNGDRWNVTPSPSRSGTLFDPIFGLAPISARNIWAVGQAQNGSTGSPSTLIEHWNGSRWRLVGSPSPGSQATLNAATADARSGHAWAVGSFTDPTTGAQRTLIESNP